MSRSFARCLSASFSCSWMSSVCFTCSFSVASISLRMNASFTLCSISNSAIATHGSCIFFARYASLRAAAICSAVSVSPELPAYAMALEEKYGIGGEWRDRPEYASEGYGERERGGPAPTPASLNRI